MTRKSPIVLNDYFKRNFETLKRAVKAIVKIAIRAGRHDARAGARPQRGIGRDNEA